jgi:hypothetical protein
LWCLFRNRTTTVFFTLCVCVFSFFDFWCLYTFLILVCGIENPYIQIGIMFIGAERVQLKSKPQNQEGFKAYGKFLSNKFLF